jgi:hypothetical protein
LTELVRFGLPRWAPRVSRELIRRLYRAEADGLAAEELIDEVLFALYARCQSVLDATAAVKGRAPCPSCRARIDHSVRGRHLLRCADCGWECLWSDYRKTIHRRYLITWGSAEGPFSEYLRKVAVARDPAAKMLAIDWIVTQVHSWTPELEASRGRPVAVNLLEGDETHVMAFLDEMFAGQSRLDYPGRRRRILLSSELNR